jgi:hypothetical protein
MADTWVNGATIGSLDMSVSDSASPIEKNWIRHCYSLPAARLPLSVTKPLNLSRAKNN